MGGLDGVDADSARKEGCGEEVGIAGTPFNLEGPVVLRGKLQTTSNRRLIKFDPTRESDGTIIK